MSSLPQIPREGLPGTDLEVSVLVLGLAPIGLKNTEAEAFALLDRYVELGGNVLDTARVYSDWAPGELHRCERILGDWLRARGYPGEVIVTTKGCHPLLRDGVPRLTEAALREDVLGSLESLGLDAIDVYYLHRDDPTVEVAAILEMLWAQQAAGRIRHLACSNWRAERIRQANQVAASAGMPGFVANQMHWNLASDHMQPVADPTMVVCDAPTHDLHRDTGLAAIPYSAQAGGYFSKYARNPAVLEARGPCRKYHTPGNQQRAEAVRRLSKKRGVPPGHVVLAWLRAQPFPVFPVVGCNRIAEVEDCAAAMQLSLEPDELESLTARR